MEVITEHFLPVVESFFTKMTEKQRALLKSDGPDHATKTLLAELLLDSVRILTKELFRSPEKTSSGIVSSGDVKSILGDSISRSLSEAMEAQGEVWSDSSESLNRLISEEVASNFLPAFRNMETHPCFIPPCRLDEMVNQACKMLKEFAQSGDLEDGIAPKDHVKPVKSPDKKFVMAKWLESIVEKTSALQEPNDDRAPIEELVDKVEELFVQRGDYDGRQLKTITPDILLILTQEMCDLLFSYITDGRVTISPGPVKTTTRRIVVVPQSHTDLYKALKSEVWDFLTLMSWWLKTKADSKSEQDVTPETTSKKEVAQDEKKKTRVRMIVKNLVSRALRKTKKKMHLDKEEDVINRLTETTWTKVKEGKIQRTTDDLKYLHKSVLKDLCKMWGKEEVVLQLMRLDEAAVDEKIASTIKSLLLTPPKKRNAIYTFFSHWYRVNSKPFTTPFI